MKGNTFTMFAQKYLVKTAYFKLSDVTMKFAFPDAVLSRATPQIAGFEPPTVAELLGGCLSFDIDGVCWFIHVG